MTDIAFHFNAPAKLAYACRLLRKAASAGSSVAVIGDEPMMDKLDELLWSFSALDFIPHGKVQSLHQHQLDHTPIWLCADAQQGQGRQVLVNLTQSLPQGFEGFERVIEVVSMEDADRVIARKRWKQYTEFGYQIVRHDLNLAS